MDANTNDFILVLEEKDKKKLSVVSSMDSQGNIKTVEPLDANSRHFMKFRKNDSLFKNFIENLSKQFKDPFHFGLYKMVADKVEASVNVLREMLQKPEENEDTIRLMQVNLEEYSLKEQLGKVDETRIDWEELSAIGLSWEQLLDSGNLEKMLSWGKSNLVPITIPFGDRTIYTEARLAFRENAEGNLTLAIHTIRKEPKLDFPFMGVQFTGEDKTNLFTTGNLGRIAEVTPKNGEPFQAFVSIDPLTNELVALKSNRVRIPTEIKGVTLSQQQQEDLANGKAITVEGMQAKSGKTFDAILQINAEKRGIEFKFADSVKFSEAQNIRTRQQQGISSKICGVELSEKQQQALNEGRTLYIRNMTDKAGQSFSAYVRFDTQENRPRFYRWNPDKKQGKAETVSVAKGHKTQVAVNNEGKTNESTKNLKEPLKSQQQRPDENQTKEEQQKKRRSRKI